MPTGSAGPGRVTGRRAAPRKRRPQYGLAYLGLLVAVAIAGLVMASAGTVWHTAARREKEAELLFIGQQYRQALGSYFRRTPGGAGQYPEKIEDLLLDTRYPMPVRHLRQPYPDPMTGRADWVEVRAGGRIVALHSRSDRVPLRKAFEERDAAFADAETYAGWVFGAELSNPAGPAGATATNAGAGK